MKRLVVAATLCVASVGYAGDWTPYLKGNIEGCNFDKFPDLYSKDPKAAIIKTVPKALRGDIVKITGEEGFVDRSIHLKNATLAGYPISQVDFVVLPRGNELVIHFKEAPTKALSKFGITQKPYAIVSVNKKGKEIFKKRVAKSPNGDYSRYFKPYKSDDHFNLIFVADENGWRESMVDWGLVLALSYDKDEKTIRCFSQAG